MSQAAIDAFNNVENLTIQNSNVNLINNPSHESGQGKGLSRLYKALKNCAGQTIGRPDAAVPCLPETRKTARAKIDEWKYRQVDRTARSELMWVTGPAGCGKTSVTESTCLAFEEEGHFVIDCFFSYSIGRTNYKYLCLSLAYQLATSSISKAVLGPLIDAVVTDDRSILDATVGIQFKRLILEPIEKAGVEIPPVFIVVDGLDECGTIEDHRERWQTEILRLFQNTISETSLPIRFLVSSRPEIWVQHTLVSPSEPNISMISLDQNQEADADVRRFYVTEFNRIRNNPEFQSTPFPSTTTWPSNADIDALVDNACGQFVYAKTVTRFLSEPYHLQSPIERLTSLLHRNSSFASGQLERLDNLYTIILSFSAHQETLAILGTIEVATHSPVGRRYVQGIMREWFSILEVLWGLEQGTTYNLLRYSHSIVFVPPDLTTTRETTPPLVYKEKLRKDINSNVAAQYPRFYRKSFTDFLHDPQRAGDFYVDLEGIYRKLTIGCLGVLQNIASSPQTRLHAVAWYYAFYFWSIHCKNRGENGNKPLLEALNSFQFTSHYFGYYKIVGGSWNLWSKMPLLCLVEKRDGAVKEAHEDVYNILQSIGIKGALWFSASNVWAWVETQPDIKSMAFLKLRLKLWYLQRIANGHGEVRSMQAIGYWPRGEGVFQLDHKCGATNKFNWQWA